MDSDILSPFDRRLIHALHVAPRAAFRQIADVLGTSDQTVGRRFRALASSAGLRVVALVDGPRIGQTNWLLRIQCTPDAAAAVANALAQRHDTAWVSLASGGTEIVCTMRAPTPEHRDALLLGGLSGNRRILGLSAHSILHVFGSPAWSRLTDALSVEEVAALAALDPGHSPPSDSAPPPSEEDEPLLALLALDGRMPAAGLASATGRHESTVRQRIAQLQRAGTIYFDVDLDQRAIGLMTATMLWLSVETGAIEEVGSAMAQQPEVPYVAATTGPTNLVASVLCTDERDLYRYLTRRVNALDGVLRVETAPIIRTIKRSGRLRAGSPHN